jgi:ABC-type multidrug transport system ATPase subunit/peptidoglycan/LPS O-acetylase OafA/YrhL
MNSAPSDTRSSDTRLHALDAVRGFALLLGVVLHAAMSYLPGFDVWPLADRSPSAVLGVTFFVIHVFRMTLFFMLAGFFARVLFHRRGTRAFIRDRATRIVIPLVVGWIVLFPMIAATMVWGAAPGRTLTPPPAAEMPPLPFPLTHLWFLYVLLLMYAAAVTVRQGVVERIDAAGALRRRADAIVRGLVTPAGPIALAVPLALALLAVGTWRAGGGIPTPDGSLIPNLPAAVAFSTAFAFGWLLQRQQQLLHSLQRWWGLHLGVAVALTVACLRMNSLEASFELQPVSSIPVYLACYTVATWAWTFGLIGAALRFFSRPNAVRRYVADASYWVYLAHLPVVFFLQALLARQPWHWSVKFPVIVVASLAFLFGTYHLFVRGTFVGAILNGRRYGKKPAAAPAPADAPAPVIAGSFSRPIARLSDVKKTFGTIKALDGVSLEIRAGEILAVLGPNGAGKSTAIALLLGLQDPTEGHATLFDLSPHQLESRYSVGVMMQEAALAPELKVRELIALTASYYPNPYTVDEVLALTRTTAIADRQYQKLSGGQKRLAQFALALCGRPALLFLDEPTVGLDAAARDMLWSTLRQVVDQGTAVVLTTHYLEEAEALAHRVAVLARGRLIAEGSVDEVRSVVDRKRVRCLTSVPVEEVLRWPGVHSAVLKERRLEVVATDADGVVRRLFLIDQQMCDLEVQRAGLAEAFAELTREAA